MIGGNEFINVVKSRRTIRQYRNEPIPRELLMSILEAARWAPSAHNLQPWKFVIIDDKVVIGNIAAILRRKADTLLAGFNIVMRDTAECLNQSVCLIVVYTSGSVTSFFDRFGEPYKKIGNLFETQSVAFAVDHLMLCAHTLGVGSACLGMAVFCEKEINALLHGSDRIVAILSMGFPSGNVTTKERKAIEDVVAFYENKK